MANRSSEEAVKALLDTALEAEDITPFLESANMIVSGRCTGVSYGADELELIERWLAAHLVCIRDPQVKGETTGDGNWSLDNQYVGLSPGALNKTRYGQQVKILDYKGTLAEIDDIKGSAEVKAIL